MTMHPAISVHPTWLLLALLPLGAMLWWAVQMLREISTMQRDNDEALAPTGKTHRQYVSEQGERDPEFAAAYEQAREDVRADLRRRFPWLDDDLG